MTSTLSVAERRRATLERRDADAKPGRRTASRVPTRPRGGIERRVSRPASPQPSSDRTPFLRPMRDRGQRAGELLGSTRETRAASRADRRNLGPPPGTFYVISAVVLVFVMLGLVMVLSASAVTEASKGNSPYAVFGRQAAWAALGLIGMIIAAQLPYSIWRRLTFPLLILGAGAMAVPFFFAPINGARSWIRVGGFSMQPSEFLKLVVVIAAADLLTRRARELAEYRRTIAPVAALAAVSAAMSLAQGDLGSAIVIGAIVFGVAWIAGVPMRSLALMSFVAVFGVAVFVMSSPRRLNRFTAFLDIEAHKEFESYQVYQGMVSIANGGLTGSGIGGSRTKLGYLPYAHSDFIFSIIADELGMIGTAAVIGGFIVLVAFGVQTALAAPDRFGMLLAGGISAWFGVQAIVNLGGVTGVMPVTGLTLPFFSAGGSSLFVSMFAAGLLLSVARRATPS